MNKIATESSSEVKSVIILFFIEIKTVLKIIELRSKISNTMISKFKPMSHSMGHLIMGHSVSNLMNHNLDGSFYYFVNIK